MKCLYKDIAHNIIFERKDYKHEHTRVPTMRKFDKYSSETNQYQS